MTLKKDPVVVGEGMITIGYFGEVEEEKSSKGRGEERHKLDWES